MTKRRLITMITSVMVLVGCMSFTAFGATTDETATYLPVPVNKTQDISLPVPDAQAANVNCSNVTELGEYNYYYTFTLPYPAYVDVTTFAELFDWNFLGDLYVYVGTSKSHTSPVMDHYADGSSESYKTFLEAGTYYVKLKVDFKQFGYTGPGIKEDKRLRLTVTAQDYPRTGNVLGNSKTNAIPMTNNRGVGAFSPNIRTQWFKFTVPSKSDVNFTTIFSAPGDWGMNNKKYAKLFDAKGAEIGDNLVGENPYTILECTTFEGKATALPAGTYYVQVVSEGSKGFGVTQSVQIVDKYAPAKPKVISYKSGNKYVKGNAEKGSTTYVKYNGKTYKATTDAYGVYKVKTPALKVGKTVQVWAKDSKGNKSQVRKVTVKNRKLAAPKVKTYKRNTKVVKGTAKKGTTVYVKYDGKTYKKKLTSKNYKVTLKKSLKKGKKVTVQVKDAHGNYSKIVTVKVK